MTQGNTCMSFHQTFVQIANAMFFSFNNTMMVSSNGNIFRVTGPLCGEFTGDRRILLTKASDASSFDVFFALRQNKRLSRQSEGWWFETPSRPLWRHCNALRLRLNGRHFADGTFKRIFMNENVRISIKISLKFVPMGPIYNIPSLVQIIWLGAGLATSHYLNHWWLDYRRIRITRPQWV